MADIKKITSDDDPDRCQGVSAYGQCINKATDGSKFCPVHGGNSAVNSQEKKNIRLYHLAKFRAEMDEKIDHPKQKSLNEEVAIMRVVLETIINRCKDASDLVMSSHQISDVIAKIEKLVVSCNKLEHSMAQYLDKNQLQLFSQEIIEIIVHVVQDDEKIKEVADLIGDLMRRLDE